MKNQRKEPEKRLNILITGTAGGIGRATAAYFASAGHRVYGIDLKGGTSTDGVKCYIADITDEESLMSVKKELDKASVELDIVINCAGVMFIDNFLEIDETRLRRIFDINLLGAMRVNKVFLPLLRRDGKIIITTSEVAPLAALPFNGVYGVTKTALDAYAQALRHEAGFLGIRVVTIRPGAVDTPLANGSIASMYEMVKRSVYFGEESGEAARFEELMRRFTGKMISPEALARKISAIAGKKRPRYVYEINANRWLKLLALLPPSTQVGVVKKLVGSRR